MAQQQSLDNIPYYPYDYAYAVKHDEVDQWKKEQEIAPAAKQLFQNAVNASYDLWILGQKEQLQLLSARSILHMPAISDILQKLANGLKNGPINISMGIM